MFVHGPAWQFKNWLWKSPVDIFTQGAVGSTGTWPLFVGANRVLSAIVSPLQCWAFTCVTTATSRTTTPPSGACSTSWYACFPVPLLEWPRLQL